MLCFQRPVNDHIHERRSCNNKTGNQLGRWGKHSNQFDVGRIFFLFLISNHHYFALDKSVIF